MPQYRESYIFRIETDTPAMLWTGHGDLLVPADGLVLDEPEIAIGGSGLVEIPDLEQLINGVAQRLEITLSGVTGAALVYAQEEAAQVPGAPVWIGRIEFDEAWQPVGGVHWEWQGEGRSLVVNRQDGVPPVRTVTLKVASGDTTRSRAPVSYFTDADQRRKHPTDSFFSNVGRINAGTSRRWGPAG